MLEGFGVPCGSEVVPGDPPVDVSEVPPPAACGAAAMRSFGDCAGAIVAPSLCETSGALALTSALAGPLIGRASTTAGELVVLVAVVVVAPPARIVLEDVVVDAVETAPGEGAMSAVVASAGWSGA
jgi:hypothetical protein